MSEDAFQVRLLGPVDVAVGGIPRPVSGLRRKAVLAVLGLHPGETVSIDRLIDGVWGEAPPATAAKTLQNHVSYLRGVFGERDMIVARPPGYVLDLPAEAIDVGTAERLIGLGRRSADHAERAVHFRSALNLWRGGSLADVVQAGWLNEQTERLEQLRLDAVQSLIDARLALGEHLQLAPELQHLTEQYPFHEHFRQQLMIALYRAGRQADALAVYQRLRRTLGEELGIDPSPALRDLEVAILRQDSALNLPEPTVASAPAPDSTVGTTPAQLPPTSRAFTGREAELAQLDAVLDAADQAGAVQSCTVVVSAVSGTAGVGKTALALQWAHRVSSRFPDGQLFVNLRGFHPSGSVMDPAEALRGFLSAFGVPAERIPAGHDDLVGLYRSVLAGKRVLVVADNARDEEQVRPLLPGSPGCLLLATSRNRLTGLIAAEDAQPLNLDLLSRPEAREMLARRLGAQRVAAEPEAIDDIIARCARLPLALAIAAAHASIHRKLPLAAVAAELNDTAASLDPFHSGDPATDVRAVISWSYNALGADAARLFRQLGLCAGPDIALPAVASLAGLPSRHVRPLLAELTRLHLVSERVPGRYSFHDLLWAYAAEQAEAQDSESQRSETLGRVMDHYLHTAFSAATLISSYRDPIAVAAPRPGVTVEHPTDFDTAMSWFTAEHPVLLAAVARAPVGFDRHTWQLAWTLSPFLDRRGLWHDYEAVQNAGLNAALRIDDRRGQAHAHRSLGFLDIKMNRDEEGHGHNLQALRLFEEIGDLAPWARVQLILAWVAGRRGDFHEALGHGLLALNASVSAGNPTGEAFALNNLGWYHAQLGDHEEALSYCRRALDIMGGLGNITGEASTLDSLGYVYSRLGDHQQAVTSYRRAIALLRVDGDRYNEAEVLVNLGDVHDLAGDRDAARGAWRQAVAILDDLGHPDAAQVRSKLHAAAETSAAGSSESQNSKSRNEDVDPPHGPW